MDIVAILGTVVSVSAFVATQLPPPAPGGSTIYRVFYVVLNVVGQNYGKAKNANAPVKQ